MKSITVIFLALAAVLGMVVADYSYGYGSAGLGYGSAGYGYGSSGYTYMPAYSAGYGNSGFGTNNMHLFGFLFIFLFVILLLNNNNGINNFTING